MRKPQPHSGISVFFSVLALTLLVFIQQSATAQQDHVRTLTGHVFDSQNQALQKAVVYLKNTKTLAVKTYISEADGLYRFPALSPSVDYEVYAQFNGARSDTKTLSAFDSHKQATINLEIHTGK